MIDKDIAAAVEAAGNSAGSFGKNSMFIFAALAFF